MILSSARDDAVQWPVGRPSPVRRCTSSRTQERDHGLAGGHGVAEIAAFLDVGHELVGAVDLAPGGIESHVTLTYVPWYSIARTVPATAFTPARGSGGRSDQLHAIAAHGESHSHDRPARRVPAYAARRSLPHRAAQRGDAAGDFSHNAGQHVLPAHEARDIGAVGPRIDAARTGGLLDAALRPSPPPDRPRPRLPVACG